MKPGPRRSTKQSDIVVAAFEILAQSGFSAVSIRGVSAALGLTPTAMYTYFPSKQELLRAMVKELFAEVAVEHAADPTALVEAATAIRQRLREHPGAVSLVTGEAVAGPGTLDLIERLGQAFVSAGAPVDDAARGAHALLAQVIGHVALEQAWGHASVAVEETLWSDEPARPVVDAGERLGLRSGDDAEFIESVSRLVSTWLT